MHTFFKSLFLFTSALFPIVNPLGSAPIFLSLTYYYSSEQRRSLSRSISINSFILLMVSYLIGTHILAFFGISAAIVQVGGGMVVIAMAWSLLNKPDDDHSAKQTVNQAVDPHDLVRRAFYPLTLPLTIDPGSISVAITMGANEPHYANQIIFSILGAALGSALICGTVYLSYAFADKLEKAIGATGMTVTLRLSAFILLCVGLHIFWNGTSALINSLPVLAR